MKKLLLQHFVLSYKINLYYHEHKLAIEIDEKGHTDREVNEKIKKQKAIDCEFIRINSDKEDCDEYL